MAPALTLHSTVFGEGETATELPSPDAAEQYLREFPQGPFLVDAHLALAHFYDDLHKVIRLEQTGRRIDYKYDCYARHNTTLPLSEQRRSARESAIKHYERLVDLLPGNRDQARYLADIRQEKNAAWFYCSD